MQLAWVGRFAEIAFRCDTETLGREIELFEQPALRSEALDYAPLAAEGLSGNGDRMYKQSRPKPGLAPSLL